MGKNAHFGISFPFFNHFFNNNNRRFFSVFLRVRLITEEITNLKSILVLLSFTD